MAAEPWWWQRLDLIRQRLQALNAPLTPRQVSDYLRREARHNIGISDDAEIDSYLRSRRLPI
jgi:hypothetical protein